jgi:hypothetical protein
LLTKLHFYGIQGVTIDWFKSFNKQKTEGWNKTTQFKWKIFFWLGYIATRRPPRVHPRAPVVLNLYKWPPT